MNKVQFTLIITDGDWEQEHEKLAGDFFVPQQGFKSHEVIMPHKVLNSEQTILETIVC